MAAAVTLSTLNGFHGFSAPKTAKAASFVDLNQSQIASAMGAGRTFLLDVSCNSSANGTNIGIYKNTNCSAQLYKLVKNSDGSYSIYTKSSGCKSVVEIANANRSNNGNVQQWVYNGHNCQKWQLIAQ